jgi:sortase A
MRRRSGPHAVALLGLAVIVTGGAGPDQRTATTGPSTGASRAAEPPAKEPEALPTSDPDASPGADDRTATVETLAVSDGRARRATLSIPSIRVRVVVVPYRGWTDDAPGTRIQDRGRAASPHGPRGGVGPGGIGNYQVTAHRTSSTRAFADLPRLERGARVYVDVGEVRYVYRVTTTRQTSFRSAASLRAQRAPVPGRPGVSPTHAMITLSTCATPEDHAAGNYWADALGNPEHRIDKIGRLVAVRQVPT